MAPLVALAYAAPPRRRGAETAIGELAVQIARVEAVIWRDGRLGIDLPEASCLIAVFDGYVVWATAAGSGDRCHTDGGGFVVLAQSGFAPASIAGAAPPPGVIAVPATPRALLAGSVPASGFGLVVFGGADRMVWYGRGVSARQRWPAAEAGVGRCISNARSTSMRSPRASGR